MDTQDIQVGDVVVLLDDVRSNSVVDFEQYIGTAGEVIDFFLSRANVKFGEYDDVHYNNHTWCYDPDQLEIIGNIRKE